MDDIAVLKDFDMFFFYGQNDLDLEIKSDILINLLQGKRSLFYNRDSDASGVKDYENKPDGLDLRINLPYDIVSSMARRNQTVSAGENNQRDRRVAVSQSTIQVQPVSKSKGEISVTVYFIPLHSFKQSEISI